MILVKDAVKKLIDYYTSSSSAKKRLGEVLSGEKSFKEINLQPPTGNSALKDTGAFYRFIQDWRNFRNQNAVVYKSITFRFAEDKQDIPSKLVIHDINEFLELLPKSTATTLQNFLETVQQLSLVWPQCDKGNFYSLINDLWELDKDTVNKLCTVLPQLKKGMGKNFYLRALPIQHIDTKFLEKNDKLILSILKAALPIEAAPNDNLEYWLGVLQKPAGFVYVRTCQNSGFGVIQVCASDLINTELPGTKILVVENIQSGYMVPNFPDTTIIFGCGNNLAWSTAKWLKQKDVLYWGDVDSWGFAMLERFRRNAGIDVKSIMMDKETIINHPKEMVHEPESTEVDLSSSFLTAMEIEAIQILKQSYLNRLEQEKIHQDYVLNQLGRILG
ncbi:MAG: Wadjet anti-phage system protein JetD domain-containing protein [Succinivibrionaceae bacterium]